MQNDVTIRLSVDALRFIIRAISDSKTLSCQNADTLGASLEQQLNAAMVPVNAVPVPVAPIA